MYVLPLYIPATWVFGMEMEAQRSLQILRILVNCKETKVEEVPWAGVGSLARFSKGKKIWTQFIELLMNNSRKWGFL